MVFFIFYFFLSNLTFIQVPKKINWEDNIPQGSPQWARQMAISKLFEERPVWPRYSVHQRLIDDGVMVSDDQMKRYFVWFINIGPLCFLLVLIMHTSLSDVIYYDEKHSRRETVIRRIQFSI